MCLLQDHDFKSYVEKLNAFDQNFETFMKPLVSSVNTFFSLIGTHESQMGQFSLDSSYVLRLMTKDDMLMYLDMMSVIDDNIALLENEINVYFEGELIPLYYIDACIEINWDTYAFFYFIGNFTDDIVTCIDSYEGVLKPVGMMGRVNQLTAILDDLFDITNNLKIKVLNGGVPLISVKDPALSNKGSELLGQIAGFIQGYETTFNDFIQVRNLLVI